MKFLRERRLECQTSSTGNPAATPGEREREREGERERGRSHCGGGRDPVYSDPQE